MSRFSLLLAAGVLFAALPAAAQEATREPEDVAVTASRIVRQDFEAISPVTTMGPEQLELTATLTVDCIITPSDYERTAAGGEKQCGEVFGPSLALEGLEQPAAFATGSRLPRRDGETSAPTVVIYGDELELSGRLRW